MARRRSYLHLTTAISFLNIGGILIWANLLIREASVLRLFQDSPLYGYGWPAFSIKGFPRGFPAGEGIGIYFVEQWQPGGFLINLATAFSILAAVTLLSEWLARRTARPETT